MKYLMIGCIAAMAAMPVFGESVTVGPFGSGADFTTLSAAVIATGGTQDGEPNIITFIDEGPYFESKRIIINVDRTGPDDMIIQGAEGIRPIIMADVTSDGDKNSMIHFRKQGNLTVRDLIIIPPSQGVVDEASYQQIVAEAGIEIVGDNVAGSSITLENILISSNDGTDRPIASLDGLTSPTVTPQTISFRDEGIYVPSSVLGTPEPHHITFKNVVVSGVSGDQGSDGIRGFIDGAPGSTWTIGPGTVISYNHTTQGTFTPTSTNSGFQPGGTTGFTVRVQGTPDNPVRIINNNSAGIGVTNSPGADDGLASVEWAIIANNSGAGLVVNDVDTDVNFENVTIVNNGQGVLTGPENADNVTYTFSNVVAAGNGDPNDPNNALYLVERGSASGTSTFNAEDSAIVLAGPYTLNNTAYGDGINSDATWVVNLTGVTTTDPEFVSLDPLNPQFAVVTASDYAAAGPGGAPLGGGAGYAGSSVQDWSVY